MVTFSRSETAGGMVTEAGIFIGYRREDSADVAGRIYDTLASHFSRGRLFKDVDNLRPGTDFGEYIRTIIPRCRAVLILIGPNWLGARGENGRRRLDDPNDWVRIEIETALSVPDIDVVPVLVNDARMPEKADLPESLRPLLRRHAATIRRDPDFHTDAARLIAALAGTLVPGPIADASGGAKRRSQSIAGTIGAIVLGVSVFVGYVMYSIAGGPPVTGRWKGEYRCSANGVATANVPVEFTFKSNGLFAAVGSISSTDGAPAGAWRKSKNESYYDLEVDYVTPSGARLRFSDSAFFSPLNSMNATLEGSGTQWTSGRECRISLYR